MSDSRPFALREIPGLAVLGVDERQQRIRSIFEGEGCQVFTCREVGEISPLLQNDRIDLVLCLVHQNNPPLENLIDLQSKEEGSIPLVLLLEEGHRSEVPDLINLGFGDVLVEPISDREISARIWNQIGLRRALRRLQVREAELEALNHKIRQEKEDRERLVSILAHDLKNPLLGFCGLLVELTSHYDSFPRDALLKYLIELRDSSFRLRDLLMNILEWSRSLLAGVEIRYRHVNLLEVYDQILNLFQFPILKKNLRVYTSFRVFQVETNEEILTAVLRNLISNAVKYTPMGGNIEVSSQVEGDRVRIEVKDSGVGMDPATAEAILSYENRISSRGTEGEKGTGLGLKLSRDLLAKVGGMMEIRSEKGRGSTFSILLPLRPNA